MVYKYGKDNVQPYSLFPPFKITKYFLILFSLDHYILCLFHCRLFLLGVESRIYNHQHVTIYGNKKGRLSTSKNSFSVSESDGLCIWAKLLSFKMHIVLEELMY